MCLPISRRFAGDIVSSVCPMNLMVPESSGCTPMIASAAVVFPEPDSPTRATISPESTDKETSDNA